MWPVAGSPAHEREMQRTERFWGPQTPGGWCVTLWRHDLHKCALAHTQRPGRSMCKDLAVAPVLGRIGSFCGSLTKLSNLPLLPSCISSLRLQQHSAIGWGWVASTIQIHFLTVLEAGTPRLRSGPGGFHSEAFLLDWQMADFPLCLHVAAPWVCTESSLVFLPLLRKTPVPVGLGPHLYNLL